MTQFNERARHVISAFSLVLTMLPAARVEAGEISFSRQVQPILAEYCYQCHGPDENQRKARLRLDLENEAKAKRKDGPILIPGRPDESPLIARITSQDPDEVMPPPKADKKLPRKEIAVLRQWVREGAKWGKHWSFEKPEWPEIPVPSGLHPIDAFIRARLKEAGFKPSPQADRHTLVRRLSLDLLGLPPSTEEVHAFVTDHRPDAYERLVDRLLASPHFGEHWGRHWLDLARYADSDGYEKDSPRPYAYLYRDWVIAAVNRDMPFDQFTIEQLAGDLLPHASEAQRVATGFSRQTLINKEGGVDQEEYRCKATVDRAHTTGAVWLGLTLGCAECHSHKYDPISQREFYQFYSFFNNASDHDLPMPTAKERAAHESAMEKWKSRLKELETRTAEAALASTHAPSAESADKPNPSATQQEKVDLAKLREELDKHRKAEPKPKWTTAAVLTAESRKTYLHVRGDFLQKGERVEPGTPAFLPALTPRGPSADRLDLAQWLVAPANPLTARVTVNHMWRHLFGRGLVRTENDFGLRGERPTHPDLLDWLALELQRLGWSRKQLIRRMVTSETYRQSSAWRNDLAGQDPLNLMLARQGRFRVEAEAVRDIALTAGGLLNRSVGGPSFKPELPRDLVNLNYANGLKWEPAGNPERFRRGLYIHFQRTVPYPMLMAFDAPESTVTCTRRERSNSPLQALTLLNNETFVECARALGTKLTTLAEAPETRIVVAFETVLGRPPQRAELKRLQKFWETQTALFVANPTRAREATGNEPLPEGISVVEAATATALSRVLLNLEETITRE
jgi:hypothetical protein